MLLKKIDLKAGTEQILSLNCATKGHGRCKDVDCQCACHPKGNLTVDERADLAALWRDKWDDQDRDDS
jgi:hypothetical protein